MQFTVTKTTTETFAVEGDDAKLAREQFDKNGGNQISHDETVRVQPRPQGVTSSGASTVQRPQPTLNRT